MISSSGGYEESAGGGIEVAVVIPFILLGSAEKRRDDDDAVEEELVALVLGDAPNADDDVDLVELALERAVARFNMVVSQEGKRRSEEESGINARRRPLSTVGVLRHPTHGEHWLRLAGNGEHKQDHQCKRFYEFASWCMML